MRQCFRHPVTWLLAFSILFCMLASRVNAQNKPAPTQGDLAYGDHERQVLDLFVAPTASAETPSPVVLYFHGGGFVRGDKSGATAHFIHTMHDAGVSVAAVNYRFLSTDPLPAAMHDGARAVQFLRHHAGDYHLDPDRFAVTGSSAGGGISMWIACHDDLADPESDDPVARQSSRVTTAYLREVQISYDPQFWLAHGLDRIVARRSFPQMVGFPLGTPMNAEVQAALDEASPITHLTADDPPLRADFKAGLEITPDTSLSVLLHHPSHGVALRKACEALGVKCELYYRGGPSPDERGYAYLVRALTEPVLAGD